tara:strand:- start:2489 stop:3031 length:543 start_codon:yes stop_codon:yes gene_type:complete
MTKVNWEKLQLKFWFEHSQTGISAKGWCNKYQLNYATARRYIKVRTVKESVILQVESNPIVKARATPKRRGPPYGSQNALKHGGYSTCFYDDMDNKIEPISIEAELILAKARIHLVMQNILQITKELDQRPPIKTVLKLYDEMILADLAIDRNIAKIEFVTRRESSLQLKRMRINRINYA